MSNVKSVFKSLGSKADIFKADGTVAGCFGLRRPIKCEECQKHSDMTCKKLKGTKNEF